MLYQFLADAVVIAHLTFIFVVVFGIFLVLRWPKFAWVHVPSFLWGALIEYFGWICPLTPLENWLREKGGERTYEVGFVEHYLTPIIYPEGLTPELQVLMGVVVLIANVGVYAFLWRCWRSKI